MKTIWINAGELSGDMQAAALLTALREREPELAAIGMGGPNLARAGQKNLFRVESLSVMGIMEVLTALPRALHMLSRIKKEMARLRPDAVVLVDAPEFNFRVAKIAASGFRSTTSSRRKYGRGARDASASSSATSNGCSASCPLSPLSTPNTAYRLIILAIRSSIW